MSDELPQGWVAATLEEISEINPRHPRDIEARMPVTFVPMPALSETNWIFQFAEERPLDAVRKGYTHFAEGDVLFAKITPCMENGKAAVATSLKNGLGCGTTELHVLRPRGGIESKFIYYFIHQESFRREAVRNFTGTAGQLRVPVSFIRETVIPLPPLFEQRRIVTKLEKLLGKVDACQKRLAKIQVILKCFRQSVLAAACSGRLTADWRKKNPQLSLPDSFKKNSQDNVELPDTWASVSVGDVIANLKYGTAKKCEHGGKGVPVLRIPNIGEGVVDHSDLKYAILDKKELESLRLDVGDILLIRSNGSVSLVGKTAIVRKSENGFTYAGYLIRIRPNQQLILPEYLNFALATFDVRLQIEVPARSTSGVNNINSDEVRKLQIAIGPLTEQEEIILRVEKLFKLADTIDVRYVKAKKFVDKLTQSILAKAFRGELVPQDPNDEPAEKLLERIHGLKNQSELGIVKKKSEPIPTLKSNVMN